MLYSTYGIDSDSDIIKTHSKLSILFFFIIFVFSIFDTIACDKRYFSMCFRISMPTIIVKMIAPRRVTTTLPEH